MRGCDEPESAVAPFATLTANDHVFRFGPEATEVRHGSSDVLCYSVHMLRRAPRASLLWRISIGVIFCDERPLVDVHRPPSLLRR